VEQAHAFLEGTLEGLAAQDQARAAGLSCEGRCHDQPII